LIKVLLLDRQKSPESQLPCDCDLIFWFPLASTKVDCPQLMPLVHSFIRMQISPKIALFAFLHRVTATISVSKPANGLPS